MAKDSPSNATTLMSIMMFLQFSAWSAWFATLGAALGANNLASITADAYATVPIAAIFAPLFLGLIADRFFASEKVMGCLMLVGGTLLLIIPGIASAENGSLVVWLILAQAMCFMPTLGLGNTIAFTHIKDQNDFPKIRVWGTIGWIVSGLVVGGIGWSASLNMFWLAGGCSLLLGAFCFILPHTPPPLKGRPIDVRSLLMVDAWKLMKDRNFLVFAVCSTLICIPLAYYYGSTSQFLTQTGFSEAAATMTIGQMSEIFFMLLIPFFFRKLGLKVMIMIAMACWILRYVLFAFGAPDQITWMLLLGVVVHGICYDFFFVTGFMYTDQKAPVEIRGQAQGLLVFLTQGVGMFIGYKIMGAGKFLGIDFGWTIGEYGQQVSNSDKYVEALTAAQGKVESTGFFESFGRMFSRDLPEKLNQELVIETMTQWKNFWMLPAIMAFIILVVFAATFWDNAKPQGSQDGEPSEVK